MTGRRREAAARSYVAWATAGTVLAFGLLLLDVWASGDGMLRPLRAGTKREGAAMLAHDFPGTSIPDDAGLDGQRFYAIARDPFHPAAVAPNVDNARYRYQRPLYPSLAWALHPSGGGPGLVYAFVIVSMAGTFLGGLALGALSHRLRGPPWMALLFPMLPGAMWALTSSVADGLAVALCLVTILATLDGRSRLAWCAAVAAVLTKETTILVPLALVLARRRREDLPLVVLPAVALVMWLAVVHLWVPAGGLPSEGLVMPFSGLVDAIRTRWLHGKELVGMASTLSATVVGTYVLVRRRGPSELRWVIAVQLGFLALCSGAVLGDDFGGTRSTLTLLAVGCVALMSSYAPIPERVGVTAGTR